MKLTDILKKDFNRAEWETKGYELPEFDIAAVRQKTHDNPTWVHFGGGNIFRAFPAAILQDVLNTGKYDRGVIVAETFDYEVIDKAYRPYDNLSLLVSLQSAGTVEKKVIASVTESLKADMQSDDWSRLVEIFRNPSLEMISSLSPRKATVTTMPTSPVAWSPSSQWARCVLFFTSVSRPDNCC